MASKSESPEILKATKDLEEISKEVETPQISETSSDESVVTKNQTKVVTKNQTKVVTKNLWNLPEFT